MKYQREIGAVVVGAAVTSYVASGKDADTSRAKARAALTTGTQEERAAHVPLEVVVECALTGAVAGVIAYFIIPEGK